MARDLGKGLKQKKWFCAFWLIKTPLNYPCDEKELEREEERISVTQVRGEGGLNLVRRNGQIQEMFTKWAMFFWLEDLGEQSGAEWSTQVHGLGIGKLASQVRPLKIYVFSVWLEKRAWTHGRISFCLIPNSEERGCEFGIRSHGSPLKKRILLP